MYNADLLDQVKTNESKGLVIVGGHDEEVAAWIVARVPDPIPLEQGYSAIGVARDGVLIGGCLYSNYRPCEGGGTIEIASAGGNGWLSRRTIGVLLGYPFHQLGCHRITACVRKSNKMWRNGLERIGFKLEGVHPQAYGPRSGALMSFGLLKCNNRWPFKEE